MAGLFKKNGRARRIPEKLAQYDDEYLLYCVETIIMVLKQKRSNTDVLIVDASKGFIKVGKNNKLRASDIKRRKAKSERTG